jgi:hypothetical protein
MKTKFGRPTIADKELRRSKYTTTEVLIQKAPGGPLVAEEKKA